MRDTVICTFPEKKTEITIPPRLGVSRFTILSRFCHVGFSVLQAV